MKKNSLFLAGLAVLLILSIMIALSVGAVKISLSPLLHIIGYKLGLVENTGAFSEQQLSVFTVLRLPRLILGILVGATLSISGTAIQGLFRNPLAEPSLIGISAGASLFAVLIIVLGTSVFHFITSAIGYFALPVTSFVGAMITAFFVYRISVYKGKADLTSLLLIGIAINAFVMACTGILMYMATNDQLRSITFWNLGSLGGGSWKTIMTVLPFSLISIIGLLYFGKPLNAMALGESQAEHLGVSLKKNKRIIIILVSLGVGASVAFSGIIGFLALVVPHIIRLSITADNRFVLPASALLGASILVLADTVARTIVAPAELPIGVLTAFIGVPIFIYIIFRERRKRFL